jgi:hypothetical protein
MELTLDRIKLLMVYDNLLTLTENIEKSKKTLLSEQPIPLFLKTLRNTLSADKTFFNLLKTESSFFRRFSNVDEMLREIEKIQNGTSSIPTRDLTIAVKQISRNVPEFAAALEKQLVNSKKFKEIASKVYPNGPSGSPNKVMRDKALKYYEQIGLKPDRVDDLLKRNAGKGKKTPSSESLKYWEGFKQGWNSPNIFKITLKKMWNSKVRGLKWDRMNKEDWNRLKMWAVTGSNRLPKEIVRDFRTLGFGPGVVSFGGEVMKRWWYLFSRLTLLNFLLGLLMDVPDKDTEYGPEYGIVDIIMDRLKKAWTTPDVEWILPMFITWDFAGKFISDILEPLLRGDSVSTVIDNIQKRIGQIGPEVQKIVDDSKEEVSEVVGEKSLQVFLKTKGKEYEPNSFKPKEGEYPAEGMDTEGNLYYFENNKWSIVE